MPYTPPSQRSPLASNLNSPSLTRAQSYINTPSSDAAARPNVTRSQSYLSLHRRTPSISKGGEFTASPTSTSSEAKRDVQPQSEVGVGQQHVQQDSAGSQGMIHPSTAAEPPLTSSGSTVSPAESNNNSSDEESPKRVRGRELDNLAELQAAIRVIEQHRESSPNRVTSEAKKARLALGLIMPSAMKSKYPPSRPLDNQSATPPLTQSARKISHSRSSTESAILFDQAVKPGESPDKSESSPELSEDGGSPPRPLMVRKKSGELVKPALRPCVRRRPSSMPGTPTYSKAVHFDNDLEHVRHFLQVDRPLAVSAGSSPVEPYDGEMEFPFGLESNSSRPPPFEWEIVLANFPGDAPERKAMPVKVERVFLSSDKKYLVGTVAVANLAFNKLVVVRFTLDYWKTTSEVVAEYNNDVRRRQVNDGYDRFNFSIKLADQGNLESKTLFFCVRYNVNGQEFWDNNNSFNFQVEFSKKALPQNGKNGMQGAGSKPLSSLPRSRPSPPLSGRPKSMPASFDDFADGFDMKYDFTLARQPAAKVIGESPRSKTSVSTNGPLPDTPTRRTHASKQAFGNRYDFGASLSAAIQAAGSAIGSRHGSKASDEKPEPKSAAKGMSGPSRVSIDRRKPSELALRDGTGPAGTTNDQKAARPDAYASEKPPLQSSSYHELLDKYCFVRSTPAKTSNPCR